MNRIGDIGIAHGGLCFGKKKKKPHTSLSHPGQEAQGKQKPYLSCSSSSSLVQHSAWHTQ